MTPLRLHQLLLALTLAAPDARAQTAPEPLPVLIVSGASNHDWTWTTSALTAMLQDSGRFAVEVTTQPALTLAQAELLAKFRAFVLDYNGPRWGEAAERNFLEAVRGGTGVVVIHAANNAFPGWKEYEELVALCWREGTGHGSFHDFDVKITDRDHPVSRGLPDLLSHPDELYHRLVPMHGAEYRVLASAWSDPKTGGSGQDEPMIVVKHYGKGRVFHTPLGHVWKDVEGTRLSQLDPQFQNLIVRGTEWAASGQVGESPANVLSARERDHGWALLFDGKTGKGWRGYRQDAFPGQGWVIEDGCLKVEAGGGGGDLVTERPYRDFELSFEWKVADGANSGVMYRVGEQADTTWQSGPEYQILDDQGHGLAADSLNSAGALYDLYPPAGKKLRPPGEFNQARIVLHGERLEHWLNGLLIVSCQWGGEDWRRRIDGSKFAAYPDFGRLATGLIALQDHGNDVWYRNLKIRELPPPAAGPEIELFNGRDLAGWSGWLADDTPAAKVWSVQDGVLHCTGTPAGYLQSDAEFTSFVLEVEWRWDPVTKQEGNSGVLLRKTGPDQIWPRSLEAQLMSGHAGDFWTIQDFPIKADAERTRGRNVRGSHSNEKPVGEWNRYEIIADGGVVVLKVNGQMLNQAYDCQVIPGRICLQSEGAPIQFRAVRLTPLAD